LFRYFCFVPIFSKDWQDEGLRTFCGSRHRRGFGSGGAEFGVVRKDQPSLWEQLWKSRGLLPWVPCLCLQRQGWTHLHVSAIAWPWSIFDAGKWPCGRSGSSLNRRRGPDSTCRCEHMQSNASMRIQMRTCACKREHVRANVRVRVYVRQRKVVIDTIIPFAREVTIDKMRWVWKKNRLTRKRRLKNIYEIVVKLLQNFYELVVHHFLIYLLIFLCRRFIVNPILFHHSIFIDCFYVHFPHHLFCFCLSFFSFSKMKLNFIPRRQQKLLWHKWTLNKLGFKGNF